MPVVVEKMSLGPSAVSKKGLWILVHSLDGCDNFRGDTIHGRIVFLLTLSKALEKSIDTNVAFLHEVRIS